MSATTFPRTITGRPIHQSYTCHEARCVFCLALIGFVLLFDHSLAAGPLSEWSQCWLGEPKVGAQNKLWRLPCLGFGYLPPNACVAHNRTLPISHHHHYHRITAQSYIKIPLSLWVVTWCKGSLDCWLILSLPGTAAWFEFSHGNFMARCSRHICTCYLCRYRTQ